MITAIVVSPAARATPRCRPSRSPPPGRRQGLVASTLFTVAVTAEDANGNPDPTFTGNVTLVIGNNPVGAGVTLNGGTSVTVAAVGGTATFTNLTLNKAGSGYTLQAFSGNLAVTTTGPFNVARRPATHLVGDHSAAQLARRRQRVRRHGRRRGRRRKRGHERERERDPGAGEQCRRRPRRRCSRTGVQVAQVGPVKFVNGVATFPADLSLNNAATNYQLQVQFTPARRRQQPAHRSTRPTSPSPRARPRSWR